jgi:hypothetical protein
LLTDETAPVQLAVVQSVPLAPGHVTATVPSAPVGGETVILPLVAFSKPSVPTVAPATPITGVAVKAGVAPAKTCPAAPTMPIVPLVVIAPPLRGAVVATLVTLPPPHPVQDATVIAGLPLSPPEVPVVFRARVLLNTGVPEKVGEPESVPESAAPLIVGVVRVLFVKVCEPAKVTTFAAKIPESAICPAVPVNSVRSRVVTPLTGPVVIPEPAPAKATDEVTVLAVAAMGTCVAVMPDKPLLVAAQVPSPRQNVEDEALVPELSLVTGRLPVTSEFARLTALLVTACVDPAK